MNLIDFNKKLDEHQKHNLGKDLLRIVKRLQQKNEALSLALGSSYISFNDKECTDIERLSFSLLNIDYNNLNNYDYLCDYLNNKISLITLINSCTMGGLKDE